LCCSTNFQLPTVVHPEVLHLHPYKISELRGIGAGGESSLVLRANGKVRRRVLGEVDTVSCSTAVFPAARTDDFVVVAAILEVTVEGVERDLDGAALASEAARLGMVAALWVRWMISKTSHRGIGV